MQKPNASKRICAEMALVRMCDNKLTATNEALAERITALEDKIAVGDFIPQSPTPKKEDSENLKSDTTKNEPPSEPIYADKQQKKVLKQLNCWPEVVKKYSRTDVSTSSFLGMSYAYKDGDDVVIRVPGTFTYDIIGQTSVKEKLISLINSIENTSLSISNLKVEINAEKPNFDDDSGIDEIIENSK